ncbi:uncharacterized protein [Procambarus clarkii]|uniref:uncharacterized protein n=1 Tax=Procambarus clarkii TaxID=6728 RepID=UPI001E67019D|nr:uncharacterized protein LOC123761039 [Procambarus clarkii]
MKGTTLLLVVVTACGLPAQVLSVWPVMSDYIDFVVTKSCFGEETAVMLEKMGREMGATCWMMEWQHMYGFPRDQVTRKRRNLLKMPTTPSDSLLACNLRGLNLLTAENVMNYDVVDTWLKNNMTDTDLSGKLLEASSTCKQLQVPLQNLPLDESDSSLLKGVLAFRTYMNCMNAEGTKLCKEKELNRFMEKMEGK